MVFFGMLVSMSFFVHISSSKGFIIFYNTRAYTIQRQIRLNAHKHVYAVNTVCVEKKKIRLNKFE